MKYSTLEEARTRLSGSIGYFDREPMYVRGIDNQGRTDFVLYLSRLSNIEENAVLAMYSTDYDKLNFKDFSLGFVNSPGGNLYYAERVPTRRYKQGLTMENLDIQPVVIDPYNRARAIGRERIVYSKAFADTLQQRFPSFEEARDYLFDTDNLGRAFAPWFAISRIPADDVNALKLYYKRNIVAESNNCGSSFKLLPNSEYLKQFLQHKGLNVE
jgi:hypothetical protein